MTSSLWWVFGPQSRSGHGGEEKSNTKYESTCLQIEDLHALGVDLNPSSEPNSGLSATATRLIQNLVFWIHTIRQVSY